MLEAMLLDNDVVLKMCAYAAAPRLLEISTLGGVPPAILRVASFSLRTQIGRSRLIVNRDEAAEQLAMVLPSVQLLEPTEDEISYAADLEDRALRGGLALDPGESQLVAILLYRCAPLLLTGDKRALTALAAIAPEQANGRMACLEQAVCSAIASDQLSFFRQGVCACKTIDKALTNCFACSSQEVAMEQVLDGLRSYIGAVRQHAGRLLIGSDDLVAISPKENRIGLM
jgi:hypothetical protein